MNILDATLNKVDNVIDTIHAVGSSPFVAEDVSEALKTLAVCFQNHRKVLEDLTKDTPPDLVANHCGLVLIDLFAYLPHVGFLHRARHSGNPFEVHGPLKRLAAEVVDGDVRLIISSEWEYSPLMHLSMGEFDGFVLLGLPASESNNSLLVPMAGHELGHVIWQRHGHGVTQTNAIETAVLNEIRTRWDDVQDKFEIDDEGQLETDVPVVQWRASLVETVRLRSEEVFCDVVGVYLFGASYAGAFVHLLAPGWDQQRENYPPDWQRAEIIARALAAFEITMPESVSAAFAAGDEPDLDEEIAIAAVYQVVDKMIDLVESHMSERNVRPPDATRITAARIDLERGTPVVEPTKLSEILCAAWELNTPTLWQSKPNFRAIRFRLLNDLVLKSAQSLDYWDAVKRQQRAK